jgi:hypothetical protein
MVAPRKALVANAIAARHRARVLGRAHAMNGGLVALQIGEACKVCGGGAAGDFAGPCSVDGVVSLGARDRWGSRRYLVRLLLLGLLVN